jgi:hypothetical protein
MKPSHLLFLLGACPVVAQAPSAEQGLRLFSSPQGTDQLRLVDTQGQVVHSWPNGTTNTQGVHLAPDGSIVIAAFDDNNTFPGVTGRLQQMDFDGNMTWNVLINSPQRLMHHDFFVLPNGNVLVMTVDNLLQSHALADGRDPALLPAPNWFPETIIEIQRIGPTSGQIVWEWHSADHWVQDYDPTLPNYGVVADHPELIDINYPEWVLTVGDIHHCNGIDYDPVNDWIIISARSQNEVWLIDHSTTTAEAAGHTGGNRGRGGDLLWRWGNPEAYGRGTAADQTLFRQHDPRFIPEGFPGAGNITIFNNMVQVLTEPTATHPLGGESAVIEIELPVDGSGMPFIDPVSNTFGPAAPVWSYSDPLTFYSPFVSGAQRLENGNTLICQGMFRRLFEVSPGGDVVWEYTDPSASGFIFQCDFVERSMWNRSVDVSRTTGGTIACTNIVDTSHAGDVYFMLASLEGGGNTPLPGGLELPFTADILTSGMLMFPNTPLFIDTFGTIDAQGRADSQIFIPGNFLVPSLIGRDLEVAYVVVESTGLATHVSNSTKVEIVQ